MSEPFTGFEFSEFWKDSDYARRAYVGAGFSEQDVVSIESDLGYKLPRSYTTFMRRQNGGIPTHTNHRTNAQTSWAMDHVAITGIYSIGRDKRYSLSGAAGSNFWIKEWGYPPIGIYFADCPSAGHVMLCLDFRACGPAGEPQVVHVDQEWDYKITFVAGSFESFIRGLEGDEVFDN